MDDKLLYNILEVKYLKMFGREITYELNDNYDLYPNDWYLNKDYELKNKILLEALEKKLMIVDTDLYQMNIEGNRKRGSAKKSL